METLPRPARSGLRNLLWLGHGVNDTHVFILPLILPLVLRELNLPFSTAGMLVSGFLFVMALSSYLFGRISDRLSPWGILGTGFLAAAACLVAAGLAPSRFLLVAFLLLAAAGIGTFHPIAYAQIDRLSLGGSGGAYGLFELWGGVALIGMYFANGSLIEWIGWQGVLIVTGMPGFVLGALFLWKSRATGTRPFAGPGGAGASSEAAHVDGATDTHGGGNSKGSLAAFAVVMAAALLRYLSSMAVVTFAPTYLALGRGLPTTWAVYLAGLCFLGSLIASPILGRLADRGDPLRILVASTGFIGPLMVIFSLPLPRWLLPIVITVLGGAIGGCAPAQNLVLTRYGSRLGRGQVFGIMMGVLSLMASVSPAIYGGLSDRFGLERALRMLVIPSMLGWALLVALPAVVGRRRARLATPASTGRSPCGSPSSRRAGRS